LAPLVRDVKKYFEEPSTILIYLYMIYMIVNLEKIAIFITDKNIDWKISKLLGLMLIDKIESEPILVQNEIITNNKLC
jgi:hypothetical protein